MRLLKIFVIGMATVIVVGIAVMGWGLTHHWNRTGAAVAVSTTATPSEPGAESAYIAAEVPAPEGMHLEQMATTGDRALLRFSGPQGDRILVVDPKTGHVTGTIVIPPPGR